MRAAEAAAGNATGKQKVFHAVTGNLHAFIILDVIDGWFNRNPLILKPLWRQLCFASRAKMIYDATEMLMVTCH